MEGEVDREVWTLLSGLAWSDGILAVSWDYDGGGFGIPILMIRICCSASHSH
jgi:hypothetical protein